MHRDNAYRLLNRTYVNTSQQYGVYIYISTI